MGVSRVDLNGEILMDLTEDTVTEDSLHFGTTAHNAAGELIHGKDATQAYATFTDAETLENINSGERVGVMFGKLRKWFSKLGNTLTLTNNLLATTAGTALDAVQGKVLDDKISALNNNLSDLQNRIFISEMGTVASKNVPPQGSADTDITFKKKYNKPPIVLITTTYIAAGISAGVAYITTTGCLISICNISPTARNVPANYIVISTD